MSKTFDEIRHEKAIAALEAASRTHQRVEGSGYSEPQYVLGAANEFLRWLQKNG